MTWLPRRDGPESDAGSPGPAPAAGRGLDDDVPLRPVIAALSERERRRISAGLDALARDGVDVDDLASLGAAFDRALTGWLESRGRDREPHEAVVERFATGIGEHLARRTDLDWAVVTDAFGTDLGLAGGRDEFVVVPSNLVAARWLKGERGWVPGVLTHLVRLRSDR